MNQSLKTSAQYAKANYYHSDGTGIQFPSKCQEETHTSLKIMEVLPDKYSDAPNLPLEHSDPKESPLPIDRNPHIKLCII